MTLLCVCRFSQFVHTPVVCNDRCRGRCPRAVHRRWWTSLWCRSDKFQLSVLTAGMRGRFFRALHTGAGPGGHVHRDTAPIIVCICLALSTEISLIHTGPHHHHQAQTGRANFVFSLCCTRMADPSARPQSSGVARRRGERRLRSMLRHERMTVAMVLAEFSHHSSRGQRMARAGVWGHEQNYTAKIRKPPTPQPELFSLEEEPGGGLPAPLSEVAGRQDMVVRHVMEDLGSVCPFVQILDLPVPQTVDYVTDALRMLDRPMAEQVIEVPTISCSPCPSRSPKPEPQTAEQLVEVPTVLSPTHIALRIAEQIVDTPVPRGRGKRRVQGFFPEQSSTATPSVERISVRTLEQNVDISCGAGLGQGASSCAGPADEDFTRSFSHMEKCGVPGRW